MPPREQKERARNSRPRRFTPIFATGQIFFMKRARVASYIQPLRRTFITRSPLIKSRSASAEDSRERCPGIYDTLNRIKQRLISKYPPVLYSLYIYVCIYIIFIYIATVFPMICLVNRDHKPILRMGRARCSFIWIRIEINRRTAGDPIFDIGRSYSSNLTQCLKRPVCFQSILIIKPWINNRDYIAHANSKTCIYRV